MLFWTINELGLPVPCSGPIGSCNTNLGLGTLCVVCPNPFAPATQANCLSVSRAGSQYDQRYLSSMYVTSCKHKASLIVE